MLSVGFEPTFSAGERPQTYVLDRAVTETGNLSNIKQPNSCFKKQDFNYEYQVTGYLGKYRLPILRITQNP